MDRRPRYALHRGVRRVGSERFDKRMLSPILRVGGSVSNPTCATKLRRKHLQSIPLLCSGGDVVVVRRHSPASPRPRPSPRPLSAPHLKYLLARCDLRCIRCRNRVARRRHTEFVARALLRNDFSWTVRCARARRDHALRASGLLQNVVNRPQPDVGSVA